MNLAAVLQIVGGICVTIAVASLLSLAFGLLVAGLIIFGFGVWEELGS